MNNLELLPLSADTKSLLSDIARQLRPKRETIIRSWIQAYKNAVSGPTVLSDSQLASFFEQMIGLFVDRVAVGEFNEFFSGVNTAGKEMEALGMPYENLILAVHLYESVTLPYFADEPPFRDRLFVALEALDHLYHNTLALLASAYFTRIINEKTKTNRELSALNTVGLFLSQTNDIQSVLDGSLRLVLDFVGLTYGEIFVLQDDTGNLVLQSSQGAVPPFIQEIRVFKQGEGVPGQVALKRTPLIIDDLGSDARFMRKAIIQNDGLESAVGIPLQASGKLVGVLVLYSVKSPPIVDGELAFITSVANEIAIGLENARLYQQLVHRTQDLEDLNKKREQFTSVVSHEVRGPLTIIGGYSQMLMTTLGKETPEGRKLESILSQARHMSRLIDDLQDVTKIQTGRFDLERAADDLIEIVTEVAIAQQATTTNHKIEVVTNTGELFADIDRGRISQAVTNLLTNAIKYSPDGGEIRVEVLQQGDKAIVRVTDQGTGILPEDMPMLFEPFSKLHRPPGVKGAGLGLFITKGIIEAHGGCINVETTPGKGSTFEFELPLHEH